MSPSRHRESRPSSRRPTSEDPGAALRYLAIRACALTVLAALTVLSLAELRELRGELAFARFDNLRRFVEKCSRPAQLRNAIRNASAEAELVTLFGRHNPDALWAVMVACRGWSGSDGLDPLLRLALGEQALRAGLLAVRAAPSDYEPWLWLARTQAAIGLREQAQLCLQRAQELAPPGSELQLFRPQPENEAAPPTARATCPERDGGLQA